MLEFYSHILHYLKNNVKSDRHPTAPPPAPDQASQASNICWDDPAAWAATNNRLFQATINEL